MKRGCGQSGGQRGKQKDGPRTSRSGGRQDLCLHHVKPDQDDIILLNRETRNEKRKEKKRKEQTGTKLDAMVSNFLRTHCSLCLSYTHTHTRTHTHRQTHTRAYIVCTHGRKRNKEMGLKTVHEGAERERERERQKGGEWRRGRSRRRGRWREEREHD